MIAGKYLPLGSMECASLEREIHAGQVMQHRRTIEQVRGMMADLFRGVAWLDYVQWGALEKKLDELAAGPPA